MQSNLYRIDDVLLRGSLLVLPVALFLAYAMILNGSSTGRPVSLAMLALLIACPLTMLFTGWSVRRRERRVVELWRIVATRREITVAELCSTTSFSRRQLRRAIRRINDHGRGLLVLDDAREVVSNGAQAQYALAHNENCTACGASVRIEVRTHGREFACPYCNAGLDSERINALLARLHEREASAPSHGLVGPDRPAGQRMNMTVFILLLLFFWPAALLYALHRYAS